MSGPAAVGSNPAIALVLALFMLGYVLWTTDRIAASSRGRTAGAELPGTGPSLAANATKPATASQLTLRTRAPEPRRSAAGAPLAPRFAACYKIAMSIAMGYMLITML